MVICEKIYSEEHKYITNTVDTNIIAYNDIFIRESCTTLEYFEFTKGVPTPVYRDKGTPPIKGGGSSFTVAKLPSSLKYKGQMPLSLLHSP